MIWPYETKSYKQKFQNINVNNNWIIGLRPNEKSNALVITASNSN
jgi:hypothetical protein